MWPFWRLLGNQTIAEHSWPWFVSSKATGNSRGRLGGKVSFGDWVGYIGKKLGPQQYIMQLGLAATAQPNFDQGATKQFSHKFPREWFSGSAEDGEVDKGRVDGWWEEEKERSRKMREAMDVTR